MQRGDRGQRHVKRDNKSCCQSLCIRSAQYWGGRSRTTSCRHVGSQTKQLCSQRSKNRRRVVVYLCDQAPLLLWFPILYEVQRVHLARKVSTCLYRTSTPKYATATCSQVNYRSAPVSDRRQNKLYAFNTIRDSRIVTLPTSDNSRLKFIWRLS